MVNQDRLVKSFIKYVKIGSPSRKEKEFADFIEELKNTISVYRDNSSKDTGAIQEISWQNSKE